MDSYPALWRGIFLLCFLWPIPIINSENLVVETDLIEVQKKMISSEVFHQNALIDRRSVNAAVNVSFTADLKLKTQEGDLVNLSFDSRQAQAETHSQANFENGVTVQEFSSVAVAASRYSLTVKGDLNEEELEAIRRLAESTAPIAKSFFIQNDFDAENAVESLKESLGTLQEIELSLERTITKTFSFESLTVGQASAEGFNVDELVGGFTEPGIDASSIRDIAALVTAVVEAEFTSQSVDLVDNGSILRSLNDLIEFLRQQLTQFLAPLQNASPINHETLPKPPPIESDPVSA